MRYFEIARPSPRHILSDTGLKEPTAGERRIDGMKSAGSLKGRVAILLEPINLPNRRSRRRHLSTRRSQ
jgi:hypothetical protein